jgi:hypothetical protein
VRDLLALDTVVRQTLSQEAAQDGAQPSTPLSRCSRIEEGECAYDPVVTTPNDTAERSPVSSSVIELKWRVSIDGAEAVHVDLK